LGKKKTPSRTVRKKAETIKEGGEPLGTKRTTRAATAKKKIKDVPTAAPEVPATKRKPRGTKKSSDQP
jgi:hypothetical protein